MSSSAACASADAASSPDDDGPAALLSAAPSLGPACFEYHRGVLRAAVWTTACNTCPGSARWVHLAPIASSLVCLGIAGAQTPVTLSSAVPKVQQTVHHTPAALAPGSRAVSVHVTDCWPAVAPWQLSAACCCCVGDLLLVWCCDARELARADEGLSVIDRALNSMRPLHSALH